jgi:hypothetical protein
VDGAAVGPSRHAPHLLAEVAGPVTAAAMVAAHRSRSRRWFSSFDSLRPGGESSDSRGRVRWGIAFALCRAFFALGPLLNPLLHLIYFQVINLVGLLKLLRIKELREEDKKKILSPLKIGGGSELCHKLINCIYHFPIVVT